MNQENQVGIVLAIVFTLFVQACTPSQPKDPDGWSRIATDNLVLHAATGMSCPEKLGELARSNFGNSETAKENPFCQYSSADGFRFDVSVLANRPTRFVNELATVQDYETQIDRLSSSLAPAQCPPTTKIQSTAEAIFNGWWVHLDIDAPCDRTDSASRLIGFEADLRSRVMKTLPMRSAPPTAGQWLIVGGVPTHAATGLACPLNLADLKRVFYKELTDEATCHYRSSEDVIAKAFVVLPKGGVRYDIAGATQNYEVQQQRLGRRPTVNRSPYKGGQLVWYADPETATALTGGRCPTHKRTYAGYVLKVSGWLVRLEFELQCDTSTNMSARFTAVEETLETQMRDSLKPR